MIKSMIKNEEGQALSEFALVLPVMLLILFGIIQFGIIFNNYIEITAASRQGARTGAVSQSAGCSAEPSDITSAAQQAATGLNMSTMTVTSNISTLCAANNGTVPEGGELTVTVTYPYTVSILGLVVSNGNLSSSTTMRIE